MDENEKNEQIELKTCNNCGKECFRCYYYAAFYTRGVREFNKVKYGWCCKMVDVVESRNTCAQFYKKPFSRKDKYAVKVCLNRLLTEITELHKIIKSQSEDNNEL